MRKEASGLLARMLGFPLVLKQPSNILHALNNWDGKSPIQGVNVLVDEDFDLNINRQLIMIRTILTTFAVHTGNLPPTIKVIPIALLGI